MSTGKSVALSDLSEEFARRFGARPRIVQAPGRVNLIGEHTDYNDGFVLPAAIQFATSVAIAPRTDRKLVLHSENYDEDAEFDLQQLPQQARGHWSDYVIGVAQKMRERADVPGANMLIAGNVPQGAGLSSSASLEVAICGAFLEVRADSTQAASLRMAGADLARLCQRAENEFVGALCGIMDQFVSVHGKKDHALLLDCRALTYQHQPLPPSVRFVICNTMVRHALAGGEYNERRAECESGARFFAGKKPEVTALRDVSMEDFQKYQADLPETVRKRCRHVITENVRVIDAGEALARHDLELFGKLMWESHASLRDDFEVSCAELDVMVELAGKMKGVYGARMTGGGFGGCTINLVRGGEVEAFCASIGEGYARATGKNPEIYVCSAADGLRVVE